MGFNFSFNENDIKKIFETSPEKLKENMDKALDEGSERVLTQAKLLAPVDTGRLRQSLEKTKIQNGYRVKTELEYAPFVEFGTKFQRAQPFLRPSYIRNERIIEELIKKAIEKSLEG